MSSIQEISKIKFGIYSTEEIHKLSVCEVNNPKLSGPGSVYDENMGPIDNNVTCPQCGEDNKKCPGHYGHIDLNYPIIHPMYYKYVTMILKSVCNKCYRFLFNDDNLEILGLGPIQKRLEGAPELICKLLELCMNFAILFGTSKALVSKSTPK